MDYKYIEQLLERYFNCQTTLQEEQILRSFFAQEDVPVGLMQYADLFNYEVESANETLSEDFDEKMMALINEGEKQNSMQIVADNTSKRYSVFAPFFRAAAIVALVLTIGSAADRALRVEERDGSTDYATAVDPYIKKTDIPTLLRIPDVSQAEAKPNTDSIAAAVMDKKVY